MKTLSLLVAVSALVLASGCASHANVATTVSTPSSIDQVMPGQSYVELKGRGEDIARTESANAIRPNTRFTCERTVNGTSCHQGHLVAH